MKQHLLVAVIMLSIIAPAHADDLADLYFVGKNPTLTEQERESLDLATQWAAESARMPPIAGPNGAIQYVYGAHRISIVCAPLRVCDVALQPGEYVQGVHLGDSARWSVEPAVTGEGPSAIQHLIIKTRGVGLETTLVVATTRRTYHMELRSHRTEYMPFVSFEYPVDTQTLWQATQQEQARQKEQQTIANTGEYLGNLDFDYDVTGHAPWKPIRVYNNGQKTIIQMPASMTNTEAPALLVLRADDTDETVMVNYRIQRGRYIVDSVFDKAIMIAGVGSNQLRVTIVRNHRE